MDFTNYSNGDGDLVVEVFTGRMNLHVEAQCT